MKLEDYQLRIAIAGESTSLQIATAASIAQLPNTKRLSVFVGDKLMLQINPTKLKKQGNVLWDYETWSHSTNNWEPVLLEPLSYYTIKIMCSL